MMIEAAVRGALTGQQTAMREGGSGGGGGRDHGGVGHLDERHFRRMEKFDGSESKWKEWSFQLKTSLGAVNPKTRDLLEDIHRHAKDPDWDTLFVDVSEDQVTKIGAELYSLLVSLLSGEALMVVRGMVGGNGWKA